MLCKIEGVMVPSGRLIIIDESDWSVVSDTEESGDYSVDGLDISGTALVIGRKSDGYVEVKGNITPISTLAGTFGFQIKANEHLDKGYYLTNTWDAADGGALSIRIGGLGYAGAFFSMSKAHMTGKKIRVTWAKTGGHGSDDNYIHILDGKFDRTSSTDFPDTNHSDYVYFTTKGSGYIWGTSIEGELEQTITTTSVLSPTGGLDDATVIIWFHDGSSANIGTLLIYNVEILDGTTNEVLSSMQRGLTPVLENDAGVADWGYYGDWNSFYA